MALMDRHSLANTLDRLNEVFFFGRESAARDKLRAGRWISSRQGLPESYHGLFAPTEQDLAGPAYLFTGEKIASRAACRHILGEEASRALLLLNIPVLKIQNTLKTAVENFQTFLTGYEAEHGLQGMYCCGTCTGAYWRNISAGGLDRREERLQAGLAALKGHRKNDGQWSFFPLYYTLLALLEIDLPEAREEMRYTAPLLEKKLKNLNPDKKYDLRRKILTERVLAAV